MIAGLVFAALLWTGWLAPTPSFAGELSEPLRQASAQLRSGHFDEARRLAQSVQYAFPNEIEPMLLLGEIEVAAGRLAQARTWFRLASGINSSHPLVVVYRKLFDEIEHRRGSLNGSPTALPNPDPMVTAKTFKRGWFGPGATTLFPRVVAPKHGPVNRFGVATAPIGILEAASSGIQASEALKNQRFLHAYMIYSELVRDHPEEFSYQLGKAVAALGMGRAKEAHSILLPLYIAHPDNPRIGELLVKASRSMSRREAASEPVSIIREPPANTK
ncbi:MAG: tetratricopeptide repeat protein [Candidatus Ozemobacteraceae bacterium]